MYATIMVPLDGSAGSEHALQFATRIAVRSKGRIVLVRAASSHLAAGAGVHKSEAYLQATADRLRELGVAAEVHVYQDNPVSAIVNAAELHARVTGRSGISEIQGLPRQMTDLIIMVTHAHSGVIGHFRGSVTEQVLGRVDMPVMVIPEHATAWPLDRPVRVLVPMDGSSLSEIALSTGVSLAATFGGAVLALQVVASPGEPLATAAALSGAQASLERVAQPFRDESTFIETAACVGEATPAIINAVKEQAIDMLVLATHGSTGHTATGLGSVAKGVLSGSTVPIVLVRPTALQFDRAHKLAVAGHV